LLANHGECIAPMKTRKILVVEDDKVTQKLIADTLTSAGYAVAVAHDGATAVATAREFEPNLVTLDVQLAKDSPDDSWDGFSVAAWLRRLHEGKPIPVIIVVSGLEPDKIIESAAAVGAYTFLPKPFTKQKLLDLVAAALSSAGGAPPAHPGGLSSA
jgi:two-component system, OmpR family, response regulator